MPSPERRVSDRSSADCASSDLHAEYSPNAAGIQTPGQGTFYTRYEIMGSAVDEISFPLAAPATGKTGTSKEAVTTAIPHKKTAAKRY